MEKSVSDKDLQISLGEDNNPIFQEIARFRAILFDAFLKPYDITMSQGWVLVQLTRQNGVSQSDLASSLDVATVTISKLIDRLEARGYVQRRAHPTDRRSNLIFATAQAVDLVKVMTRTIRQVDRISIQGIEESELEATRRVLVRMRQNLRTALDDR